MPDVRCCKKCGRWRHLKSEWPKERLLDPSAVCLVCDLTGKRSLKDGFMLAVREEQKDEHF